MEQERFPIGKRTYFHDLFFDFGLVHGLALEPYVRLVATASLPALSRARTLRAAYELLLVLQYFSNACGGRRFQGLLLLLCIESHLSLSRATLY